MRVILAAGGSGGHIFPATAVSTELEKKNVREIFFVSSKRRLDKSILKDFRHKCFFLSVNPMPRKFNFFKIAVFVLKLMSDMIMSLFLIIKLRPDVVVGFGGYSSGTIVLAARILNIPILIHEQNFLPGRANKILSYIANRVAVSFKETAEYFSESIGKVFYSGNPIRLDMLSNNRLESARRLGLSPAKKTILIMGGSQGSSFLNETASKAVCAVQEAICEELQFVHLTGKKDYGYMERFYQNKKFQGKIFEFLERIDDAYAVSDIVISRSGAAALFELAYYAKPMILIPYPNKKNSQRLNAMYFSREGAAVYEEENDLSAEILAEIILQLLRDEKKRDSIASCAGRLSYPLAGQKLAEEIIKLRS